MGNQASDTASHRTIGQPILRNGELVEDRELFPAHGPARFSTYYKFTNGVYTGSVDENKLPHGDGIYYWTQPRWFSSMPLIIAQHHGKFIHGKRNGYSLTWPNGTPFRGATLWNMDREIPREEW